MRAKEFITESSLSKVHDSLEVVALSLPNTFIIPDLKNSDFYDLYRFGVAIAAVRGESGNDNVHNSIIPKFKAESSWGEHQIVSSLDPNVGKVIDSALKKVNKSGKKAVSTANSNEFNDTYKNSPIKPFKGYKK
jgi:hypothetical protein